MNHPTNFARVLGTFPKIDFSKELDDIKLTVGSQWRSVTGATYKNALQFSRINLNIENYFREIECSDELFFGRVLIISPQVTQAIGVLLLSG
jgi:hypothetical protein